MVMGSIKGVNPDSIPRYKEPIWDEPEPKTCADCCYYKEVSQTQNGLTSYVGVCVFEVYQASTLKGLASADIAFVEPKDDACDDFWE